MDLPDRPVATVPYVHRRIIHWGDCDPAGIIYTPRFLDFALEAVEGWQRQVLGLDWYKLKSELGMGMPIVHASLDFLDTVKPGEELDIEVLVTRLGRSSIEFRLTGRTAPEQDSFTCTLISTVVDDSLYRAIPVPPELRQRIEDYIQASEGVREA